MFSIFVMGVRAQDLLDRALQSDEPPHDPEALTDLAPDHPHDGYAYDGCTCEHCTDIRSGSLNHWLESWDGKPGWVKRALENDLPLRGQTHQGAFAYIPDYER